MKIAVQIFGFLRTYEQCFHNLKTYILDKYDCDVFMHTWEPWDNSVQSTDELNSRLEAQLYKLYGLKNLIIEKHEIKDIDQYDYKLNALNLQYMFHSMSEANRLREEFCAKNNVDYNYVLAIRPDILLCRDFDIDNFTKLFFPYEIENAFFVSLYRRNKIRINDLRCYGAADTLFFAKPDIISNIYKNKNAFLEKAKTANGLIIGYYKDSLLGLVEDLGYKVLIIAYAENKDFIIQRKDLFKT